MKCIICGREFKKYNSMQKGCSIECRKILHRQRTKEWATRNKTKRKIDNAAWYKKYADLVFNHYGKQCVCCGETNPLFLTIDHVLNDGYSHRKLIKASGAKFYKWLVKNNFPDVYQTLCYNCNCGKSRNHGVCPHVQT